MKTCTACKKTKETTEFYTMKRGGYRAMCKDCWKLNGRRRYYRHHYAKYVAEKFVIDMYNAKDNDMKKAIMNGFRIVEVKAPAPRVNVWEWIKRLFG